MRWNLKEAVSKSPVRRTEITYKARLREISWQRTTKSNNYHFCSSRVNVADTAGKSSISKDENEDIVKEDNENIALSDLRYLKMLHYNFDHKIQVGEMIVNADVIEYVIKVFEELFAPEYEIESMRLIDDFWMGDGASSDDESVRNNNTSAFCYRVITRSNKLSNHAYGRAIDINPKQNPYVWYDGSGKLCWSAEDADKYIDRNNGAGHMIIKDDICCRIFEKYGFKWGGNWSNPIDYQHFER